MLLLNSLDQGYRKPCLLGIRTAATEVIKSGKVARDIGLVGRFMRTRKVIGRKTKDFYG